MSTPHTGLECLPTTVTPPPNKSQMQTLLLDIPKAANFPHLEKAIAETVGY